MDDPFVIAQILITFGGLFLVGLMADLIGRHTPLPRVTLLLVAGMLVGPDVLDWLPEFAVAWFPVLTSIALSMIGFMLGQKLTRTAMIRYGRQVLGLSIGVVLATILLLFVCFVIFGVPAELALLLAGIATATDPAATTDVVREARAKGAFSDTLLGIVALDDVWGLLAFSFILVIVQTLVGEQGTIQVLTVAGWEIGGAIFLGVLLGVPMATLSCRIRPGEASQAETLGFVLFCTGLAIWFEVSYLLAAMTLGAMVANFAPHCRRPFSEIEKVEWPFMILFFLLAGAGLRLESLYQAGSIGLGYIALRLIGRIVGGQLGGIVGGAAPVTSRWMGIALLPQAGVAIVMALLASQRFPEYCDILLPVVLGSTVLFELIGPILTRLALIRVGDTYHNSR